MCQTEENVQLACYCQLGYLKIFNFLNDSKKGLRFLLLKMPFLFFNVEVMLIFVTTVNIFKMRSLVSKAREIFFFYRGLASWLH